MLSRFLSALEGCVFTIVLTAASPIWAADRSPPKEEGKHCVLMLNINASTPMSKYQQTNDRNYNAYIGKFGKALEQLFATPGTLLHWLDVGGGYGLAPLQKIMEGHAIKATVINAQDAWSYIFNLDKDAALEYRIPIIKMGSALNVHKEDVYSIDEFDERPRWSPLWYEKIIPRIKASLEKLKADGIFNYQVGLAESILSHTKDRYDVITDLFGAYFYSADRVTLLDEYYESLSAKGEALVTIFAEDRHIFEEPKRVVSYGPVSLMEGSSKSFEEILVEKYPTVFDFVVTDGPQALVRNLRIRKDKSIQSLNLRNIFEVTESHLDETHSVELMRQIPQITVRLRDAQGAGLRRVQ